MAGNNSAVMPYNLEAEQSVLGCILIDQSCMEEVVAEINADCFYLPQHKAIFSSMMVMYTQSKAIDPVILADTLAKSGTYDLAGGRDYLVQLAQTVPSTANIENYINIVKEKYCLRCLVEISNDIIEKATSGEVEASVILDSAEQSIYNIRQGKDKNGPTKVSEIIVNDVYNNLLHLVGDDKDKYKGISSGFGMLPEPNNKERY